MKKKIYLVGMAICLVVFCVSAFQLVRYYLGSRNAGQDFEQLAEMISQAEQLEDEETFSDDSSGQKASEDKERIDEAVLRAYQELKAQNSDMVGWISIEGTKVNYPVMYTPDRPNFYLNHNFEKEYNKYGVPYVAEHCDPEKPSDNLIIYAHHMKDGSMFTGLMNYTDQEFLKENPLIGFDTLTERGEYEVLAVFLTTVDEQGFPYYLFADAQNQEDFDDYVRQCKAMSLYDTGVTAEYGDKLITLSTCEYSNKNGRLVVVGKKRL